MPTQTQLDNCNFDDNHSNLTNAGLKSGSKYVRMMWQEFEPNDDDFQFAKLDQLIECAHQEGKSVDLRVMLSWPLNYTGEEGLPQWLINKGINEKYDSDGISIPDWNNQTFLDEHAELIYALGYRYDNHKDINSIDIGSIGYFGEWHYYHPTYSQLEFLPSESRMIEIIDLYYSAFPNTPKVPLAGAHTELGFNSTISAYLKNKNDIAWRGDSWGGENDYFNDLYDSIHNMIPNAWESGMVVLEISGDGMDTWPGDSTIAPLSSSIALAEKWGVSQIHTKHGSFPSNYIQYLIELEKKLGFRFVLKNTSYNPNSSPSSNVNVSMTWENVGIAPSYRDFRIAFRLRDNNGNIIDTDISTNSVQGWLPNSTKNINALFNISNQVSPGDYFLDTALVFNNSYDTMLPIAVTEARDDKWVSLGNINIQGNNGGNNPSISSVSAASNTGNEENLIDGDNSTYWANANSGSGTSFDLHLDGTYTISSIDFLANWDTDIIVEVNGQQVFSGWTTATSGQFYTINFSAPTTGNVITIKSPTGASWLNVKEVKL